MGLKAQLPQYENKPYYTQQCTIHNVLDISGTNPYNETWTAWDIGIEIELEFTKKDGDSYLRSIFVGGNVEFNEDNTLKTWGKTGWRLDKWLQRFGIMVGYGPIPEIEGRKIPKEIMRFLVKRKVMILNYVTGINENKEDSFYYNIFDVVLPLKKDESLEETKEKLEDMFLTQVEKGYPKSYNPSIIPADQKEASPPLTEDEIITEDSETDNADPYDDVDGYTSPDGESGLPF